MQATGSITAEQRYYWRIALELKLRKSGRDTFQDFFESTPNAVVSQTCELFWIQAQQLRREIGGGLLDAIDRLTLDQQGPQQQPKDSGVGDRQWSRAYGHAALQDRGQTEPVNEVIDEGKGAEPLSQQR